MLEYATNILSLNYYVTQARVQLPPPSVVGEEDILIYPTAKAVIPDKSQIALLTSIQLTVPKGHLATVFSINIPSPRKPLVFPGLIDPAYLEELILLVGNLTNKPLVNYPKLPIAYVQIISANAIAGCWACGLMRDLGLLKLAIHA